MWPPQAVRVDSVQIALNPNAPANARARAEHCFVSQEVVDLLGLSTNPVLGGLGQLRVFADATVRSANFTAAGLTSGTTGRVIWIYPDAGSDEGGVFKLFGTSPPASFGNGRILTEPPSQLTLTLAGGPQQVANAWAGTGELESAAAGFVELVEIPGGNQLVVIAPHGGKIEKLTSEQLAVVKTNLGELCPRNGPPTIWHCRGDLGSDNHSRLHITTTETDERSFPGLDEIWSTVGPYQGNVRFRYAVAFHGLGISGKRIVLGGRATDADKLTVRNAIAARFAAQSEPINFCIVRANGTLHPSTNGPECLFATQFGASEPDNIVNRLSENDGTHAGRGGIQLEQTSDLREGIKPFHVWIAEGVADAMCQLISESWVYVRDNPADVGEPHNLGTVYRSPDVCIVKTPLALGSPPLTSKATALVNDKVKQGEDSWIYVRAYNRTGTPSPDIYAHVWDSEPASLVHPLMWNPIDVVKLGPVASNTAPTVGEIAQYKPQFAGHRCLVVILADQEFALGDLQQIAAGWGIVQFTDFIRSNRLAAWRNYNIEASGTGGNPVQPVLPVKVAGFPTAGLEFTLEVGSDFQREAVLVLVVPKELYEALSEDRDPAIEVDDGKSDLRLRLPINRPVTLGRGFLPRGALHDCRFEVEWDGPQGEVHTLYLRQLHGELEVGRVSWEIRD